MTVNQASIGATPSRSGFLRRIAVEYGQELIVFSAIIALFIVVSIVNPRFISANNLTTIFAGNAYIAVAAIGMSMVIITGHIDVSVGALIGVLAVGLSLAGLNELALLALGAGAVAAVLGAALLTTEPTLPTRLAGTVLGRWPVSDVVVATGVVLVQLASANVAVRLVLDAVGVPATSNEKQLKGGRVLGPMERLFIVGLGAVGELTAAAVVIAAKGLLRFPELQRAQQQRPPAGPSDVTEYFLVGSFASWLVALGGAALIHLA